MFRSGHNFVLQNILSWLDGGERFVHHNLENIPPNKLVPNHLKHGGFKILIYRDFDDWLASVIMKCYKTRPTRDWADIPAFIDKVCQWYWLVRKESDNKGVYKNWIVVHYDEFVRSEKYRREICHLVSGVYSEKLIDHVPANGNHSSFDGKNFKGSGSKMNVLNRAEDILQTKHKNLYLNSMEKWQKG